MTVMDYQKEAAAKQKMSKFKVSIINYFMKICYFVQRNKKQYLYIFTFLKALRDCTPFTEKQSDDKVLKYWVQHTHRGTIALADKLFDEEKYLEVYELLNRIRFCQEFEVLWRIARALHNLSFDKNISDDMRWEMIQEAHDMLIMALPAGQHSADVHKWLAIIMDTRSGLMSLEIRVKYYPLVRAHLIRACELNPKDFTTQYMMGKWCFEMSQLNWIQRIIAKYIIAADPPSSSYEEAYSYLSKAEELQPRTFLPNIYHLGRTCLQMGQFYKAKYYLNLAISLRPRDECEISYVNKAKNLIKKLERYDLGKNVLFYDTYPFGFND